MKRKLSITLSEIAYNSCAEHLGYEPTIKDVGGLDIPNPETKPMFMSRKLEDYYSSMHETRLVKARVASGRDNGKAQAATDMAATISTDEEVE